MVRLTDHLDITMAVDWVVKAQTKQTKQTNKKAIHFIQLIPFASSENVAETGGEPMPSLHVTPVCFIGCPNSHWLFCFTNQQNH